MSNDLSGMDDDEALPVNAAEVPARSEVESDGDIRHSMTDAPRRAITMTVRYDNPSNIDASRQLFEVDAANRRRTMSTQHLPDLPPTPNTPTYPHTPNSPPTALIPHPT